METKDNADVIVIGGGAAGFFAAINCAEAGLRVIILEKSGKLLSKVRISGGGRCNVTHACFDNSALVKNYPRGEKELRNVFSRFSTADTIDWFRKRGVELKTEADGRMFPITDESETIISCLMNECTRLGVRILNNVAVERIERGDQNFLLNIAGGGTFHSSKIVIATGGHPKTEGFNLADMTGHKISAPVPSLFTFNIADNPITQLMGVSVPHARVRIAGTTLNTEGPLLITHWGMSGPAVLKASAWGARILSDKKYDFTALITWVPMLTEEKLRIIFNDHKDESGSSGIYSSIPLELPRRLWEFICNKSGIAAGPKWGDLSKKQMNILTNHLINDEYQVRGKTTFKEEFVTCGGVLLKNIDMTTMQSKAQPGLYFAGEVLDIDGVTGGFNFQNAWSTAWVASQAIVLSFQK